VFIPHNFRQGGPRGGNDNFCSPPLVGDSGETPPEVKFWENYLVKYCNFVVNLDRSYKVAYMTVEVILGFFSLEGNPLL
jgi:hypothetical protein